MKTKSAPFYVLIAVSALLYGLFAVRKESEAQYGIIIDLSNPLEIEWPFEIAIVGDYGQRGLRIGPGIGRGWAGEAGGRSAYRFHVPADGAYHVWAYSYWNDECSDAIFAQINDTPKAVIGNNPVHKQWHWVRGFEIDLERGTHDLELSNHCDNIAVQEIMLLNSPVAEPAHTGLVFSDLFYDGFDGCAQGNFEDWKIISGHWHVANPFVEDFTIENFLIGQSTDEGLIVYESDNWSNYILNTSIYLPQDADQGQIGICFGFRGQDNFYELTLKPAEDSWATGTITRHNPTNTDILKNFDISLEPDNWQYIVVRTHTNHFEIEIENNEPISIDIDETIRGGIGFRLIGPTSAYFNNVHVHQMDSTSAQ